MIYVEAAANYPADANPRWVACHAAYGRRPRNWEFIIWIGQQWAGFAQAHGIAFRGYAAETVYHTLGDAADEQFDAWLIEQAQTMPLAPEVGASGASEV